MKKLLVTAALVALQSTVLFAQTADDIIRASRDRIDARTVSTRSRMTIHARDGSTTERLLDQYSLDSPQGNRTVIVFQRPASVAGTRFLTMENPGRAEDRWIFLPSLGKVRRISSAEGSGSFMGTDFTYDDISLTDRDYSEDSHRLLREETMDGRLCWVIESIPRGSDFQYSKTISWIDKSNNVAMRIQLFDRRGELLKQLDMGRLETVQGRLTPMTMRMANLQARTSTVVDVEILRYDETIPESVFTTRFLETGRP